MSEDEIICVPVMHPTEREIVWTPIEEVRTKPTPGTYVLRELRGRWIEDK